MAEGYELRTPKIGEQVVKTSGYPFPGEVRSVFTNRKGEIRYVIEATGEDYAGMLHIFNPSQVAIASPLPPEAGTGAPPPSSHLMGSEKYPAGSSEGILGTSGWRPIETAPKDGSFIDLWVEFYDQPEDDRPGPVRWTDCHWNGEKWENREGLTPDQYMARVVPTHWMPSPSAPAAIATGDQP